jgi:hypothetical protein
MVMHPGTPGRSLTSTMQCHSLLAAPPNKPELAR